MADIFYRDINPLQSPFDMGLDPRGMPKVGFNIRCVKGASNTFLEELMTILETASVGTRGTNMFAGSKATIPAGAGPYLSVVETGGTDPERVHNQVWPPSAERPNAQVVVRALNYETARLMARAAWDALGAVRNATITV